MISRARLWYLLRIAIPCAGVLILFFSGIFPIEEWLSKLPIGSLTASVAASDVASLTNEERIANGLAPLNVSPLLSEAAELKAQDMARNSYYAHTGPDGKTPLSWLSQVGYRYLNAGENLVIDRTSASQAVDAWMNSPEHRENILRPQFTEIGVGVAEGEYEGVGTIYVVEEFGTPYPTYTAPRVSHTVTLPPVEKAPPAAEPIEPTVPKASTVPAIAAQLPIPSIPKIASLAAPTQTHAKSAPKSDSATQKGTSTTSTTAVSTVTASSSPVSTSTVAFALAPEFFKPVTIPKSSNNPAAPEGSSQTRLSVWLAGIKSYFSNILHF